MTEEMVKFVVGLEWLLSGLEMSMLGYGSDTNEEREWLEVSLTDPCPACQATSECTRLEDGEFIRCVTTISERPLLTGGWLHRVAGVEAHKLVVGAP